MFVLRELTNEQWTVVTYELEEVVRLWWCRRPQVDEEAEVRISALCICRLEDVSTQSPQLLSMCTEQQQGQKGNKGQGHEATTKLTRGDNNNPSTDGDLQETVFAHHDTLRTQV